LKFKCVGARGGDGHTFSSDQLKRTVASGLVGLGMRLAFEPDFDFDDAIGII
jgi:hypothetical protein